MLRYFARKTGGWWPGVAHLILAAAYATWFGRWLLPNSHVPFIYDGDGLIEGALIKSVLENGWYLDSPLLGAPFGSNYLDYPLSEGALFLLIRVIGWFTRDFGLTLNVFYATGFVLTYWAGYFALRKLGIAALLAVCGAAIYTLLPYHFYRLSHLHLAMYFVVPLAVWLAASFADNSPEDRIPLARWLVLHKPFSAAAILVGSCGIYYAFFGALIVLASGSLESVRLRVWTPCLRAAALSAIIFAAVVVNVSPTLMHRIVAGTNSDAVVRLPSETETYGLNLSLMVLPQPDHRSEVLQGITMKSAHAQAMYNESKASALGIIPTGGLLLLLACSLGFYRKALADPLLSRMASLNLLIILYATIAGFGFLFSIFVTPDLRALNRASVYVAFVSIFAAVRSAQHAYSIKRPSWPIDGPLALALCLVVIAIAWYDQVPKRFPPARELITARFDRDRRFVEEIERHVPPATKILEFPYVKFPEEAPRYKEGFYGMARGSLHSSTLQWSYGAMRGSDGDTWIEALSKEPVEDQLAHAAESGFGGAYVDRTGYPDNGEDVVRRIAAYTRTAPIASDDGELAFFPLKVTGTRPIEIFPLPKLRRGFYGWEKAATETWSWASGSAEFSIRNPRSGSVDAHFNFALRTFVPRVVELRSGSIVIDRFTVAPGPLMPIDVALTLAPGENNFELRTDVSAELSGTGDPRPMSFALYNFTYRLDPRSRRDDPK